METLLNGTIKFITYVHNAIMTWNDSYENVLTDKELHFWVIGILGMAMLLVIFPLFKLLSRRHIIVVAWLYVFTVMVVITFAIEIGQGLTGTGTMDFDDIVFGLVGFMVFFLIFEAIRLVVLALLKLIFPKKKRR